ncbi:MAG: carbohydrate ABC transporter permease [Ardenticatenaceae bacterium]|nr:carbohydrate ABC transporter permease [Ardenticatenaceae bacterium]
MRINWQHLFHHLIAWSITAVFLLPLFWVIIASLRQVGLPPPTTIEWWPTQPHWQNYSQLFQLLPITRYLGNSLLVTALAIPITWLVASLGGFSISQLPPPWRRRWLIFSLVLLMIPGTAVWLFRFRIYQWLNLLDSVWALALPAFAASSPLFVLLFYWAFRRIPTELFEAARLDGASASKTWWQIACPLTHPTSIAIIILTFVMYWSDFVSPILYIYQPTNYTLPVGLQILKQLDPTNWPYLMAGSVLMTLPILLLFILLQRYFLQNLTLTKSTDI